MAKKITGNNNIMIDGDKNTILQSPVFNVNPRITKKIEVEKPENSIIEEQAYEIRRLITSIVENTGEPYPSVWNKFKRKFKVASYRALPSEKYNEAIKYLTKWGAATTKNLKKCNTELYRKKKYAAIYARIKNHGLTKEQFHNFLEKNFSVSSLTDLSLKQLDTVYHCIMNMK